MADFKPLANEATGPLKGVKIVDLTSVVFGAYATQILGDLGADVVKVESPASTRGEGGDIMRWTGPVPEGAPKDLGPIFITINRNKRSMFADLNKPSAKRAVKRMIEDADVLVSSVRYDGMKRLGLSYEEVKAIKPDIIFVHGAGYGKDGPYAGLPAYDDLIQAQTGLADILNRTDGNAQPRYLPTLVADKVSGLFMVNAILAALYHRAKTGEGQFVETPMFEMITSFVLAEHMYGHVFDPPTGQWAYTRVANPDRRPFKTADGYIGLLPYTQKQWDGFFEIAAWPELRDDPRFATHEARTHNIRALYGLLEQATTLKTSDEWLSLLSPLGIPVVKLNRLDDLPNDPHLQAVGLFERYEHPHSGPYVAMRSPVNFEKTPANIRRHAPRLGEHNAEFLDEDGDAE